jgi:hypothetical protein
MPWITLNSSLLHAAQYQEQDLLLELEFRDGSIHRYFQVPGNTFEALLQAESKGAYFNLQIRKHFNSAKIKSATPTGSRCSSPDGEGIHP